MYGVGSFKRIRDRNLLGSSRNRKHPDGKDFVAIKLVKCTNRVINACQNRYRARLSYFRSHEMFAAVTSIFFPNFLCVFFFLNRSGTIPTGAWDTGTQKKLLRPKTEWRS